jgi:hypothetical protein
MLVAEFLHKTPLQHSQIGYQLTGDDLGQHNESSQWPDSLYSQDTSKCWLKELHLLMDQCHCQSHQLELENLPMQLLQSFAGVICAH